MKLHGTTLHIDKEALKAMEPEKLPQDFWTQQEEKEPESVASKPEKNGEDILEEHYQPTSYGENAPSLESATAKRADTGAYKSVISTKKATTKKGGLGGKRGLGAQKVSTDFSKMEQDAQKADEEKPSFAKAVDSKPLSEEEQVETLKSMKEAYENLSERQKQTEEKLRMVDPNKAEHFERLGMGFKGMGSSSGGRSAISHSAVSDMKTIEQVNPVREKPHSSNPPSLFGLKEMEKELLLLELGLASSKGKDSPFGRNMSSWSSDKNDADDFWDSYQSKDKKPQVIESIPNLDDDRPR